MELTLPESGPELLRHDGSVVHRQHEHAVAKRLGENMLAGLADFHELEGLRAGPIEAEGLRHSDGVYDTSLCTVVSTRPRRS